MLREKFGVEERCGCLKTDDIDAGTIEMPWGQTRRNLGVLKGRNRGEGKVDEPLCAERAVLIGDNAVEYISNAGPKYDRASKTRLSLMRRGTDVPAR